MAEGATKQLCPILCKRLEDLCAIHHDAMEAERKALAQDELDAAVRVASMKIERSDDGTHYVIMPKRNG